MKRKNNQLYETLNDTLNDLTLFPMHVMTVVRHNHYIKVHKRTMYEL